MKALKLDGLYKGTDEVNGEDYNAENEGDNPNPFMAVLDVGLARTSTGAKVFAVMKGVTDGGIYVPHSEKRFFGYDSEEKQYSADAHRERIFGKHVADYMKQLQEESEDAYKRQFSKFIEAGVTADGLEGMYKKAHDAIRANPEREQKTKKGGKPKRYGPKKLTYEQRKQNVEAKKEKLLQLLKEQEGEE